ncbi:helix-turn-helix domain-containing protein [Pseudomonas aeruginosa]|uniref:helix-turn-helix domain-containing protein n=1 Tax=Pseudomonas aeruginosa TaxID=287 RepID=UPI00053E924A|nr:helix-turn-helix transcriptional regulator [Pseudomonas aeruginosa]ALY36049.1 transcriptional regulator [Pseudomonas aeruginosa]MBX6706354.1 helix-turn-helix transcriptional regulator [Pseudomonas aeruginosa]MCO2294899.1 helix-turn-helix transcriptional regulator [Pseudomonas aeruginosa]MCO2408095.1 helix-turn-helix transcriptional regulator [Pseudomonas aeruginosa]MCO2798043.1 helix-turn-helix transcriptional regulator [Pseudomonas aeruginosa]
MSFAQNLLRLRQQNTLTQRQMAERLGVTVSQLRHFETKGGHPSLVVLQTIAGRFAVPLDWLVCERSERQALPEDLRLQFEAIGRLRLDERRAIRALLDDLIRQYMAKRNAAAKPLPAACTEATETSP